MLRTRTGSSGIRIRYHERHGNRSKGGLRGRRLRAVAVMAVASGLVLAAGSPGSPTPPALAAELASCSERLPLPYSAPRTDAVSSHSTPRHLDTSSDGRFVSYQFLHNPTSVGSNYRAWVMRLDTSTGTTERIDLRPDGSAPDDAMPGYAEPHAGRPSLSSDGRYVAFTSESDQLVAGDDNGEVDAFLHDVQTGITEMVSVGDDGASGGASLDHPTAVSDDGRYVLFTSINRLVASDEDEFRDVYLHDRETGTTTLEGLAPEGRTFEAHTDGWGLSGDGRYLLYWTYNSSSVYLDVFRRDLSTGEIEEVTANEVSLSGTSDEPVMSADGNRVAFIAQHPFVEGDDDPLWRFRSYVRDLGRDELVKVSSDYGGALRLSDDGSVVGFEVAGESVVGEYATSNLVTKALDDGSSAIFLHDDGRPAPTGSFALVGDGATIVNVSGGFVPALENGSPMLIETTMTMAPRIRSGVARITEQGPSEEAIQTILPGNALLVDVHGSNLTEQTTYDFGDGLWLENVNVAADPHTAILRAAEDAVAGPRETYVLSPNGCRTSAPTITVRGAPEIESLSIDRLRPGQQAELVVSGGFLGCPCEVALSSGVQVGEITTPDSLERQVSVEIEAAQFDEDSYADLTVTNVKGYSTTIEQAIALHTTGGEFHALEPSRILDTRFGVGGPTAPVAQSARTVAVAGLAGIPAGDSASAVVMNVTVTTPTVGSYVSVWPSGSSQPLTSSLNFVAGETRANQVTVPLGDDGSVEVFVANGNADLIFDVVGFYSTSSGPAGARLTPLPPKRLMDSRLLPAMRLGPRDTFTFGNGIPELAAHVKPFTSEARSAVLNVTVVNPSHAGWLTVAPVGETDGISSINFVGGQTIANQVIVPLGDEGQIDMFNSNGTTDVIVDLVGYYGDDVTHDSDSAFRTIEPRRFLDSRFGVGVEHSGMFEAGSSTAFEVAGHHELPETAASVVGNVTAVAGAGGGFVTVWPNDGENPPGSSTANYLGGQIVPNAFTSKLGPDGELAVFTSARAHTIVDVAGWFTAVDGRP